MIKKIILSLSMVVSFILSIYGIDDNPFSLVGLGLNSWEAKHQESYGVYTQVSDIALEIIPNRGRIMYDVVKKDSIHRDEYGFPVATFFGRDAHFLLGGNYVVFRFLDEEESGMVFLPETLQNLLETGHDICPSGVEVSCSSYLTEGIKQYTTSGLAKTFIGVRRDGGMLFNTKELPWAEGEEGPGIGVTLSIQFISGSKYLPGSELASSYEDAVNGTYDTISIMNGYVDFYRPYLFKRNNRLKKVLIKSTDNGEYFEQEYELQDVPEFQTIQFPRKAQSVDMIIREVYEGTHYDDTVITSILPLGKNVASNHPLDDLYEYSFRDWKKLQNNN